MRRKSTLRANRSFQSVYERAMGKRYAVLGLARARGTTHIALSISNILSMSGLTVLLYEKSGRSDIIKLLDKAKGRENVAPGLIRVGTVWYVCGDCSLSAAELPEAECTVYDLGTGQQAVNTVLPYLDRLFLVSGSAPWTYSEQNDILRRFGSVLPPSRQRLLLNPSEQGAAGRKTKDGICVSGFPYIPDSMYPDSQTAESILKWI